VPIARLRPPAAPHLQAFLAIEPPDLLEVHDHAAAARHLSEAPIAEAPTLGGQLFQQRPLGRIVLALAHVPHR